MDRSRYQAQILANVREIVVAADLAGRITYWGNGAAEALGYTAPMALGQPLTRFFPDVPPTSASGFIGPSGKRRHVRSIQRMDGAALIVEVRVSHLWRRDGQAIGRVLVATDATREHEASRHAQRLTMAMEQSPDAVAMTDPAGTIEYVNRAFERVTGFGRDEVIGRNARLLSSGLQPRHFYQSVWSTLARGQSWTGDFVNRRKDGSLFTERATISPMVDDSGSVYGYMAIGRDVTDERRRESAIARRAYDRALISGAIAAMDSGAPLERLASDLSRQVATLPGAVTAGIFLFDSGGCAVPLGFSVRGRDASGLPSVPPARTSYLRRQVGHGPWIGRWRSQPGHPYDDVFRSAGAQAIAYAPIRHHEKVVGFVQLAAGGDAETVLVDSMPALMEFASIAGGLLGGRFTERMGLDSARSNVSTLIRTAAFVPVFQPIFDTATGHVVGYEGLTRFKDRQPPDRHFDEAQRLGLGMELEIVTMEAALDASKDLPASAWLGLNASPRLILESAQLPGLLATSDRDIVLEVTEHEVIADYELFRSALQRFGPKVRLAVDDAGSGFASLRHILELRPALIKLDRALIEGLDSDLARRAMVAGMQHFADDVNIRLIAEGVETALELATLRELDIPLGQGYLLGRPTSAGRLSRSPATFRPRGHPS